MNTAFLSSSFVRSTAMKISTRPKILAAAIQKTATRGKSALPSASSTMDLVEMDHLHLRRQHHEPNNSKYYRQKASIMSTLQYQAERDYEFERAIQLFRRKRNNGMLENNMEQIQSRLFWLKLNAAAGERSMQAPVFAEELDLVEAAQMNHFYDKVLLLINHAEAHAWENNEEDQEECEFTNETAPLTGRGSGQVLSLFRRTSLFCNEATGLEPDLFVVAPLRRSIQTAFKTFPYYTPDSVRSRPWVCLPGATVTLSIHNNDDSNEMSQVKANPTESEMLEKADNFLQWLKDREERVIVVSTESTWLHALGCVAQYERSSESFGFGEMRAIGLNYK